MKNLTTTKCVLAQMLPNILGSHRLHLGSTCDLNGRNFKPSTPSCQFRKEIVFLVGSRETHPISQNLVPPLLSDLGGTASN